MIDIVFTDAAWANLQETLRLFKLRPLEQSDRDRINHVINKYRSVVTSKKLTTGTKKQVASIRSQTIRFQKVVETLYKNEEFRLAGVSEKNAALVPSGDGKLKAAIETLLTDLQNAETRFQSVTPDRGKALADLVGRVMNIFFEKNEQLRAPPSWAQTSQSGRFHPFVEICVNLASNGEVTSDELKTAGERATREVREYGDDWDELVGADTILPARATD